MEPTPVSTQALSTGTRIEEFIIVRVLGSGGFGITYLAQDTGLNRQVVIKENLPAQFAWRDPTSGTVRPHQTTGGAGDDFEWSMKNFLREAETLASLDHTGIVRVLRKFETNGTAYFVMPFVEGVAFDTLIEERKKEGGRFTEDEMRGLLDRMLQALGYLHDRGIYHRDIKPGNILISNDGVPALIDFGSARQRLSERSMTVVESAGYTPFEQLQSRGNVGPWSDLYALGGTLAKAITFETPPKANDRVFDDPWVPLAERESLRAIYSAGFLASIDRAMAVRIENRWKDAGEWLAALRGNITVAATPGTARPQRPQSAESVRTSEHSDAKKNSRLPRAIAAFAACFILVLGMGSMIYTQVEKRNAEAVKAERQRLSEMAAAEATKVKAARVEAARVEQQRLADLAAAKAAKVIKATQDAPFVNSLGMKFVPVPITGGPSSGQQVLFSIWETRVQDYRKYAETGTGVNGEWQKPEFKQSEDHPVANVSWEDAVAFCEWLTQRERRAGRIPPAAKYRLPTDHEWSCAVGIGDWEDAAATPDTKDDKLGEVYPWSTQWPVPAQAGNYDPGSLSSHRLRMKPPEP